VLRKHNHQQLEAKEEIAYCTTILEQPEHDCFYRETAKLYFSTEASNKDNVFRSNILG